MPQLLMNNRILMICRKWRTITRASSFKVSCSKTYTFSRKGASSKDAMEEVKDYFIDITQKAKDDQIDAITGRSTELLNIHKVLLKRTKKNPILIGEAGVGKTAIVEELARSIVNEKSPYDLFGCRILQLDVASLIAGTMARGEMEERVCRIIEALTEDDDNDELILFIDEIHMLTSKSSRHEMNICDMFKPFLARGKIRCIGATTYTEYEKYFKNDKAFDRRFQPINVKEPSKHDTIDLVKNVKERYEDFHKCSIDDDAIYAAVEYADKYLPYRNFPDKAIDLIDEACSKCVIDSFKYINRTSLIDVDFHLLDKIRTVAPVTIDKVLSLTTDYDVKYINESENSKIRAVEDNLSKHIIGQDDAVETMIQTLRKSTCGFSDPTRPICSMLFVGPTGVGKTESVKMLARSYYGDDRHLLRFDMSEYMESFSVSSLIGAPPGYVGYDEGGKLTTLVKRNPHSVILFDEIEKAHPKVLNLLLQIMEDGVLTDSSKQTVSFKNNIIVMTSNVGYSSLHWENINDGEQSFFSFGGDGKMKESSQCRLTTTKALTEVFRPEFVNRIDRIVPFHKLSRSHLVAICDEMLDKTVTFANQAACRFEGPPVKFEVSDETRWDVLRTALEQSEYGARPLSRAISYFVEDKIADYLLQRVKLSHSYDAHDDETSIEQDCGNDTTNIVLI